MVVCLNTITMSRLICQAREILRRYGRIISRLLYLSKSRASFALFTGPGALFASPGARAEHEVDALLRRLPAEYHVMRNVLFSRGASSTQIDHLVVSPYGVFCIETKGYSGWILGAEHAEYWVQSLPSRRGKGAIQYRFYSPIRQSQGHARRLRHLLRELGELPIFPLVVFSETAELKITIEEHTVVYTSELIDTIRDYQEQLLSPTEQQSVINIIRNQRVYSVDHAAQHVRNVHARKAWTEKCVESGRCPRCGGKLVPRQGAYGAFYGCSGYPNCRMTVKC